MLTALRGSSYQYTNKPNTGTVFSTFFWNYNLVMEVWIESMWTEVFMLKSFSVLSIKNQDTIYKIEYSLYSVLGYYLEQIYDIEDFKN